MKILRFVFVEACRFAERVLKFGMGGVEWMIQNLRRVRH